MSEGASSSISCSNNQMLTRSQPGLFPASRYQKWTRRGGHTLAMPSAMGWGMGSVVSPAESRRDYQDATQLAVEGSRALGVAATESSAAMTTSCPDIQCQYSTRRCQG